MITCDLCALDCGSKPFELPTPERTLNFCCEGCRGIYMMLNEIKELPDSSAHNTGSNPERSGS